MSEHACAVWSWRVTSYGHTLRSRLPTARQAPHVSIRKTHEEHRIDLPRALSLPEQSKSVLSIYFLLFLFIRRRGRIYIYLVGQIGFCVLLITYNLILPWGCWLSTLLWIVVPNILLSMNTVNFMLLLPSFSYVRWTNQCHILKEGGSLYILLEWKFCDIVCILC